MVILGGMGNIWGVIFGACFLEYLDREGLANIGGWLNGHFGPGGSDFEIWHKTLDVPLYEFGIFGVILVVVMLFRPEGLIPSSRRAAEFREGVHDEPLYDVAARRTPLHAGAGLMAEALLETVALRKEFGGLTAVDDVDFTVAGGFDRQPDRAERRRQDDVLQHAHRRLQADHGPGDLRRPGHDGEAAARVHGARDRPHVPEHPPLQER